MLCRTLQLLGFMLPSVRSIREWLKSLDFRVGLKPELLSIVKDKVEQMEDKENDCIVTWDEVSIKQHFSYDKNLDEFEGIEDHGVEHRRLEMATEALFLIVRGKDNNWCYPSPYYFSKDNTTSEELERIVKKSIEALQEIGLRIRIGICNMSFTNQGLYRNLKITHDKPYIEVNGQKIYMVFDSPHLIKLVRNNLQRHNFVINNSRIKWYHIQSFWKKDCKRSSRFAPKLTKFHFYLSKLSKMKVKLATQLFSHSVAAGMKAMVGLKLMKEDALITAKFVERMDKLFDSLNTSKP